MMQEWSYLSPFGGRGIVPVGYHWPDEVSMDVEAESGKPEEIIPARSASARRLLVSARVILALALGLMAFFVLRGGPAGPAVGTRGPEGGPNTGEIAAAPVLEAPKTPAPAAEAHTAPAETPSVPEVMVEVTAAGTITASTAAEAPEAPVAAEPAAEAPVDSGAPLVRTPEEVAAEALVVEVTADGEVKTGGPVSNEEVVAELKRLQEKFDQLQETVNLVVTQMMADVETENAQLRGELQRLQARDAAGLLASTAVPRPAGELIASLGEDARAMGAEGEGFPLEEEAPLPPGEFSFTVLEEWGRDPEAVAQLGGDAPTLKGVVGMVPRGSARADVEALGRELRAKYAAYDNINIEVFDDAVAAQSFADSQVMEPEHRVLSVSKYAATGRDVIAYYEGGENVASVTLDAETGNGDTVAEEGGEAAAEPPADANVEAPADTTAPQADTPAPKRRRSSR